MSRQIRAVGIRGTGSYVPEKKLTNDDLSQLVDTNDEWITSRTGIRSRRIAAEGESTSDLSVNAARKALEMANLRPEDIDLVICATITGDYLFPATACRIQAKLGCGDCGAFDLSAACSGWLYGLSLATQQIATGAANNVLLVGAEILSRVVNYQDRSSCILFGDGAGATILSAEFERGEILHSSMGADGNRHDVIWVPAGGSVEPVDYEKLEQRRHLMVVRGREVYKFAVARFVELVELETKKNPDLEMGMVIPHQVNLRIIESARNRLGLSEDHVYTNIDRYGNTSAASIPIAFDEANRSGLLDTCQDKLLVFCAFGAGLTWASGSMRW